MPHLKGAKRAKQIIHGATRFFAERGLSGQTRELSASLGIAQPLLYRYFPSKEALIRQIFTEVFENRWNSGWRDLIENPALPVHERYRQFYLQYHKTILTRDWVRLLMHSELNNFTYGKRVVEKLRGEIFMPLTEALRSHYGYPSIQKTPMTQEEFELLLELHGMVYYNSVRKHIYELKGVMKIEPLLDNIVFFMDTAYPHLMDRLFRGKEPTGPKKA